MTEQIITMTGLEFTVEGRTVAYGAVIREGSGEGELLGAGARWPAAPRGAWRPHWAGSRPRRCSSGNGSCWRRRMSPGKAGWPR